MKFRSLAIKRMIIIPVCVIMVFTMMPDLCIEAFSATEEHPEAVTITVKDENGAPIENADVAYTIDSDTNGDDWISETAKTDSEGTIEVLPSEDYVEEDMYISYSVSKEGYTAVDMPEVRAEDTPEDIREKTPEITEDQENFMVTLRSEDTTGIEVVPISEAYDGSERDAVEVSGTGAEDEVSFQLDGGEWTTEVPAIKMPGRYQVAVKVKQKGYDDYFCQTVTAEITEPVAADEEAAGTQTANDTNGGSQEAESGSKALLTFPQKEIAYFLGNTTVSGQTAEKQAGDDGLITYSAKLKNTDDTNDTNESTAEAGLSIDKETGELTVADMEKLAAAVEENGSIQVVVAADKTASSNGLYGKAAADYTVTVAFGEAPSDPYRIQNPDGKEISGPNGENGWYNTSVHVVPAEPGRYLVAKDLSEGFSDAVTFDNQGQSERRIYLKDRTTGYISSPVRVEELTKIDSVKPDSDRIEISYSEPLLKKIFWFYNAPVTVTVTGYDDGAGIDHFNWTYNRDEDAGSSNLEKDQGQVKAKKAEGEASKYTASFTLPMEQAEQLCGSLMVSATDGAGLTSDEKKDDGTVVVVDTVSPTCTVKHELESPEGTRQEVDGTYYYSNSVKFTLSIKEANFYPEDVVVKVAKDGAEAEAQRVEWKENHTTEQNEGTFTLEEEGTYRVAVSYKDRSDNRMEDYRSSEIVIDSTKPVIDFQYSNGNKESASSGNAQEATITVTEHNFRASDIQLDVTAVDRNGNPVQVKDFQAYLQDSANWEKDGDVYTAKISKDFADAIYTMTLNYRDLALNRAEEVRSGEFIADHTAPSVKDMKVTYSTPVSESDISGSIYDFYNKTVTVTFEATDNTSGIDYFTWSYHRQDGASQSNVNKYEEQVLKAVQDASDSSRYTAKITLPLKEAEQIRGQIGFTATDKYSNMSDKKTDTGRVIIVDSIAPSVTAEYAAASRVVGDCVYYNQDFDITFKATEANFFNEDVIVEVSKDGGEYQKARLEWEDETSSGEEDIHLGTYTIKAPKDHTGDGTYRFRVKYSDRSHNTMEDYISKTVVIDTVKPVVKVDYANHDLKNQLSDREGHDREYYDEVQTATITVTEEHFAANEVKFDITAKDASGSALDTDSLIEKTEWTSKGDQHTITITYPGDANYSFDIAYADLATNQADNYQEDYFTVDKTKPTDISISYSTSILDTVLSGISFGFYQAPVTVTVKGTDRISGIHNFRYSYLKAEGVSGVNAELKNQVIEEDAIEISGDGMTGTAVFKIPHGELGVQNQFHGTVAVRASDRSGNQTEEYNDSKRIVVDNIAPTASITYNAPVNTENGVSYYNEAIQATIMVNEANFYQEDVKVSVASKEGTAYEVSPEWSDSSTDVHVGTFSLTGDGDYFITVNYTDKSSNQMAAYTSGQMTVDTQIVKPTITVNGEDGNGKAYKDEVIPSVVFDDVNFSGYEIHMTRTRYNKKDEDVTDEFIGNNITLNEHGGTGVFDTFVKKPEVDGIYTLSVTQRDKAMHSATESITFTVNRYGSVYVYSDYLSKLIKNGGAYVKELKEDLVVTEYNADKLVSGSLNVNVSHDGKPVQDVSYKTDPEINDKVTVGSSGWYQYRYTVAKKNFASDGVYRMSISSRDATGNQPDTEDEKDKEVLFYVDSTAPEINSISGLDKPIINAQKVRVTYSVYDTIALKSVKVYVDGKLKDEITDFSGDSNNYEGSFTLHEKTKAQKVKIIVEDKAGNVTDTSKKSFKKNSAFTFYDSVTVSTSFYVRALAWWKQHIVGAAIAAAIVAATAVFLWLVWKRRKKRTEEHEAQ